MANLYELQTVRIQQALLQKQGVWLHPPCSADQVESAEREHNITLPTAYRHFLLQIGNGGWLWTWPLYPLAEALSCVEGQLAKAFPFTGDWPVDEQIENTLFDKHLEYDLDGALPIFGFGCTHHDILVMNGSYVGTVMYNGSGTDQGFIPYSHRIQTFTKSGEFIPKSERLDYLSWFEKKLDNG